MNRRELRYERAKYTSGLILLDKVKTLRERLQPSTYEYMMKDKAVYIDRLRQINEELEIAEW